jgi:hypothetical protein
MTRPHLGVSPRPFFIALCIVVAASAGVAVYGVPAVSAVHVHHKPGSIVGAETPQLIPDDAAYRQVLIAIAGMAARPDRQNALESYFLYMEQVAAARAPELGSARFGRRDKDSLRAIAVDLNQRSRAARRTLGSQRASLAAVKS